MRTKSLALALTFLVVLIATRRTDAQSSASSSSTMTSKCGTAASFAIPDSCQAVDPGVQAANRNTGAGVASLSASNGSLQFFQNGLSRFQQVETVSNSANVGLGPRFNSISCVSCHSQPAAGGSGAAVNPQFAFTNGDPPRVAPDDTTPYFITANGPTREARFPFYLDNSGLVDTNTPDGGVEDLFTVSGRTDARKCVLLQPPYDAAREANNIVFRIPIPVFGDGLVENLDDSTLLHNQAANLNNSFGVEGTFNYNGNDNTISRFGWKAQNKSLELFAGEAYNVEMGITNEIFTQERPLPEEEQNGTGLPANCMNLGQVGYPEDATNFTAIHGANQFATNASIPSDVVQFAMFMRLLAPPQPGGVLLNGQPVSTDSISDGEALFSSIGCATCHNPAINSTQPSHLTVSLSNQPVNAFSDFEIHHMGTGLADNISQGTAGGDQFRTAPLWGLGQRIFLLHDGRTTDLITAIQDHQSTGSEANTVINNFNDLTASQQQKVLDFLRSL
jgi:CxxC motif-containing protein (DUF1111 family)